MTRERLHNILLVLVTLIAAIFLLKVLWNMAASVSGLVLTFALAWLIAFIFRPVASWLAEGPAAQWLIAIVRRKCGVRRADTVTRLLDPIAVTLVYLTLLGALVVIVIAFVPLIVNQARQLGANLGDYFNQAPVWVASFQTSIAEHFNVPPELVNQFYKPEEIGKRLSAVIEAAPWAIASLIRDIASGVGETLLVLALSYYLMLDARRLSKQMRDLVPQRFYDEYELTVSTLNRAFGGFLRGQLVMATLSGVVTGIAASVIGMRSGVIVGAIAGLVIFIPLIGAPIALFLPSIVALIQGLPLLAALLLLAFLFVFQQILLHLLVPRIMSESIGMPSSLVLISVLLGVQLWGVWGFVFGIPVAGAIYSVGLAILERFKREQDRLDSKEE